MAAVVAALILTLATTSTRLFIASTGEAVLRQQLDGAPTDPPLTVTVFASYVRSDSLVDLDRSLQQIVSERAPGLRRGVFTVLGGQFEVVQPSSRKASSVQPASRAGFLEHVRPLQRAGGKGVWLSDRTAEELGGLRAGETVLLRHSPWPQVRVRVAGIYRDLAREQPAPYWGTLLPDILPDIVHDKVPPALLLADLGTLGAIGQPTQLVARLSWDFYLPDRPTTLERVSRLGDDVERVKAALLGGISSFSNGTVTSPLAGYVAEARRAQAAVSGPVEAMSLSGRALALGLAAAVGFYMVRRRRGEFMVMSAQGVGGVRLGARAMVEAALPMALGGLAGWGLALLLARRFGPSPVVPPEVARAAAREAGLTLAAGLLVLGAATWLVSRHETHERVGRIPGVLTRPVLWEALALLLAAAALYEVTIRRGAVLEGGDQIPRVDRLLVLFPLLFIGGLSGLISRGLGRLPAGKMTRFGRLPPPLFLALRRLVAAPRMALLLLVAASVSLGLLVYAGVLGTSTRATALAKARVVVGSDTSEAVSPDYQLPASSGLPATKVIRVQESDVSVDPDDVRVTLLAIDGSSFARGAFWDRSFAAQPLGELLRRLDHPRPGRLAAISAGRPLPPDATLTISTARIPLDVTPVKIFPGMTTDQPTLVVSRDALARSAAAADLPAEAIGGNAEVWARQDVDTLRRELGGTVISTRQSASAAALLRNPAFAVVSWTLDMLEVFSVVVGLVAVAALLLYVQARQRGQVVAAALLGRMGLARSARWLSAALELAGMLLLALVIGGLLAFAAATLVLDQLDLAPQLEPGPLLRLPVPLLWQVPLGALVVSFAGAALVQWRADRANVAEVMRLAG